MTSGQRAAKRRYTRDFLIALLAYGILLVVSVLIVLANPDATWRYAVAPLPMTPAPS